MANRTGYPGTQSAGDVLTSANFSKLPGGLLAYAVVSTDQTGITAETDLTSLTVTVTVNTSRLICIEGVALMQQKTGAGSGAVLIYEGASLMGQSVMAANAANHYYLHRPWVLTGASAGSHTYKLRSYTDANSIDLKGTTSPAYILVRDLGPSF